MWYAPIGSLEYIKNLHNDILIKRYILSEQRLKQQNLTLSNKKGRLTLNSKLKKKQIIDTRKNRIKGCAIDVIIKRSYKKTVLDVVTYDSIKKVRFSKGNRF